MDYEQALEHLAVARQAAPNDLEASIMMSYFYRRQGKLDSSVSIQEACQKIDARFAEIPTNLASTYLLLREFDKAIASIDRAILLQPESANNHYQKARIVLRGRGDFDEAQTALAHIYATVGEHDKAIDALEHLLSIPSEVSKQALPVDPRWKPLREHARFVALCK